MANEITIWHPWLMQGGKKTYLSPEYAEKDALQALEESGPAQVESGLETQTVPCTTFNQEGEAIVSLTEEYGYRYWLWYTGMDLEAFRAWWTELKTVEPYFFSPTGLPGVLVPAWYGADGLFAYGRETFEPHEDGTFSGDVLFVKNLEELPTCHLHCDDDSWVIIGGERVMHAGRAERRFITGADEDEGELDD